MPARRYALCATLLLLFFWSTGANAVLISSSVGDFDVTTEVDFDLAFAEAQPWWLSATLADEFATLVGNMLGAAVNPVIFPELGPAFLYEETSAVHWEEPLGDASSVSGPYLATSPIVYAVARRASVPLPATVGLLFMALAAGVSARRLNGPSLARQR